MPVFNQSESPAGSFVGEPTPKPQLFVSDAEEEIDPTIDVEKNSRQFNPNNPLDFDTGEMDSVVDGLGIFAKSDADAAPTDSIESDTNVTLPHEDDVIADHKKEVTVAPTDRWGVA